MSADATAPARGARAPGDGPDLDAVADRWRAAWPDALAAWGRASRMHAPVLHTDDAPDVGSFAWYDGRRVEVHVDLADAVARGLADHAVAVLAHEVGHHLLSPVDHRTRVRIAARVRAGLVDQDRLVGPVANLWSDLLINDRLQRTGAADLAAVWRALGPPADPLMALVLRADEVLWRLPRGTLAGDAAVDESAAWLCARLVRVYARDPVGGAGGFASLVRTTLAQHDLEDAGLAERVLRVVCTDEGDAAGLPYGLAGDAALGGPVVHPALDPAVVGDAATARDEPDAPVAAATGSAAGADGNLLLPADLHAVLQALGDTSTLEDVAVAWYRERASAHLVPFPVDRRESVPDPLLGGYEQWDVGDDLADVDWTGTVSASPVVVPGITTVRRQVLDDTPATPLVRPVDLDLYLDSSGSMPDPKQFSHVALAGAVLALSALRVGARVQATTWSGPHQVAGTDGFTRDADAVLRAVVAFFGSGTAFPLALLERTYLGDADHGPTATGPTHVAVVSDDGVLTMFQPVRRGPDGRHRADPDDDVAVRSLARAGGGASLLLDVPERRRAAVTAAVPDGVDVYWVDADARLVDFAADFARRTWSPVGGAR
ncbi:hypothetical protein [Cellulomonas shaoxiangyii]|uniref:VWA domain-containing protein n=1 Tax=Cellulomonas shaoxiangyii TaxID=2566013 RepID=A0A4V1CMS9_9CELL|nr:hypothetical protein [Cellulomonas shaoxiangyii]QCB94005.1 hypothetical protein E5225_10935 [Cellulomonas shaoxiangyii]TGY80406.1 hypothetical protein E5226_14940 [Cellulomonas shaoxiangyii]